ncbi:MAG: aldehyde dehydrogenase family protein, partial [Mobilitalea sp.]
MENIELVLEKQRKYYATDETKKVAFRLAQLRRLEASIKKHEKDIYAALKKDLNKAPFETYAAEIGLVLEELNYMKKHLVRFAAPKRVKTSLANFLSTSTIYQDPYGIVLIMSPWNYPFQLTMSPLIGAIGAGNCVVVKPSNYSPNTSKVIEIILSEAFKEDYVAVIQGGRDANQSLLEKKFDYICFTGSVAVGKMVMEAASRHLTPVTLELGGKSPCIVDETADIDLAAKRIVWGKYINAGQTCVAPDYLLVHPSIKAELLKKMQEYINQFYHKDPNSSNNFPKIINEKHFHRLLNLMIGEDILTGGNSKEETNQIFPTILDHITWESPIMAEEIFGPILPVIEYKSLEDIIVKINSRPK